MERMAAPSVDRISLLPDSLLEDILVRLPLQEAVKTSILSKRWISLWTQLPKLVFDNSFCTELIINDVHRLMLIIFDVLFHIRKPLLDVTFSVDVCSSLASKIDQLVNYVGNNGIEYFNLELPNGEVYDLPSLDQLHSVKCLSLEACIFKIPSEFKGFTMLTYLNFYFVQIYGDELSCLVSSCPLLEGIYLGNLRCCWDLVLDAPNLRFFCCVGFSLSVCIKSTPRLEKMRFSLNETVYISEEDSDDPENKDIREDIVVPFGVIPAIRYIHLDGVFLMYMNAGTHQKISRCQNVLNDLKFIKLHNVPFELIEVSQNVLNLIRHAPNLEKIVVSTCTKHLGSDLGVGVWQAENLSDVSLNRLRRVRVLKIDIKKSELLFIKTLLAKSPMLETMVFSLSSEIHEEYKLEIVEEIRLFQRASSQVDIIAFDPKLGTKVYVVKERC